jgi:hypothetical protein
VLAAVLTPGTLTGDFVTGDQATYVMALSEDRATHEFGVCFADTGAACLFSSSFAWLLSCSLPLSPFCVTAGTSEFFFSHFRDDAARTQLETILCQVSPVSLADCRSSPKRLSTNAAICRPSRFGLFAWR